MKVVYVAGPYSAPNEYLVKKNIARAEGVALGIWLSGKAAAICPHLNTAHWGSVLTHKQFLDGDVAILKRCDALIMVEDWKLSKGAVIEHMAAVENNVPVFYTIQALYAWLDMEEA